MFQNSDEDHVELQHKNALFIKRSWIRSHGHDQIGNIIFQPLLLFDRQSTPTIIHQLFQNLTEICSKTEPETHLEGKIFGVEIIGAFDDGAHLTP